MSEDKRKGPGTDTEAPQDRCDRDALILRLPSAVEPDAARCRMCGHRIYSRDSIAAGVGRDCRRKLRRALAVADLAVVDAFRIALAGHETPAPAVTAMGPAAGAGHHSGGECR